MHPHINHKTESNILLDFSIQMGTLNRKSMKRTDSFKSFVHKMQVKCVSYHPRNGN